MFPIQFFLKRIVKNVAERNPRMFFRIGTHVNSVYIIDPTNLPFILRLIPNPDKPLLRAERRQEQQEYDARISGSFLTLLGLIDGRIDGDSVFFTRDLKVEGDTEAVVCLRNAIDDLDGSILDDVPTACGPFARPLKRAISMFRQKEAGYAA
jgi:predicted lipid carrier protein YhbT